jgi:Predicted nucleotide-binding protein containing TIR-like domain
VCNDERPALGTQARIDGGQRMTIVRRIFVSSPRNEYLDDRRNELKWAIIKEIEALGYEAQVFGSPEGGRGLASGKSWSPKAADEVMRRCIGAAILGFPIWQCSRATAGKTFSLVTEYCHYEGAIARAYGLPILAVLEDGAEERVFFNRYAGDPFISVPAQADLTWVMESSFRAFLEHWNGRLGERRDVFLGYCSKARDTANAINLFLKNLGVSVLDWADFAAGGNILDEIERASSFSSAGIFLFTQDDFLEEPQADRAAPRDNVVFEAGYFTQSKGRERVLIIRENGVKMPADVVGNIYLPLMNRKDISSIETQLRSFVEKRL